MPVPAMYHDAYSFALREWKALGLSSHPSDEERATVASLVARHINHVYPRVPATARASAVSYGVSSAERDMISSDQGGFVGTVGGFVDATIDTVQSEAEVAARVAGGVVGRLEASVRGILAAILRAVPLPRAALPAKVPTDLTHSYSMLGREAGTLSPTRLSHAGQTRARIRRLGR